MKDLNFFILKMICIWKGEEPQSKMCASSGSKRILSDNLSWIKGTTFPTIKRHTFWGGRGGQEACLPSSSFIYSTVIPAALTPVPPGTWEQS